jgi:hypothetical protein
MSVKIAEYLGHKTDIDKPIVKPAIGLQKCPFMDDICIKLSQGNKPVCTVRKTNGDLWIVCRNRLCATKSKTRLSIYQKEILFDVAKCIYGEDIIEEDIAIKREVNIPVIDTSNYHADYIMMNIGKRGNKTGQKRVVLEMQGGGETSNTGSITRLIDAWEKSEIQTNLFLSQTVSASPIVTNAWRRQQEQFIIKGNIAQQTGGGIVFCVGKPLYDYLWTRVRDANLNDLRHHNWTLALLCFKEDETSKDDIIKFVIDRDKVLFTNYLTFIQTLINQGMPNPEMFMGKFELLSGTFLDID